MRQILRFGVWGLLSLNACGGAPGPRSDSAIAAPANAASSSPSPVVAPTDTTQPRQRPRAADGCPKWGDWQICSVEDRLTRAGLVLERDSQPVRHQFLAVPGVRYKVFKAEVQVFVYPTAAERASDTDQLDTVAVAPRGARLIWPEPPTLVTSGNLAAIILSVNARQSERIALALGAGLPPHPP